MHYYPLASLAIVWLVWIWESYLSYRQYKVYLNTDKPPKELRTVMSQETFDKAKSYAIDRARFSFISSIYSQIQSTATIVYFLIPYFWNISGQFLRQIGSHEPNSLKTEIFQSLMFVFVTSLVSTITNLPLSIYGTFVIEERHSFNKQTARFYAWDNLKKFIVSFLISAPITSVVVAIVRNGGEYFFFYLWIFGVIVACLLTFFHGEIAALFDKFTPMPATELRDKIEALAKTVDFPLSNIFVVEGSKRSAHSNAYQSGVFNKKRIVIYDTLLEDKREDKDNEPFTHDEILAVICHELGHWYRGHLLKRLGMAEVNFFLIFMIFSKFYTDSAFYAAFGFVGEKPVIIGLILLMMILTPYNELEGYVSILLSRKFEYEADEFAKKNGYADQLKTSLIKLNISNLGFPVHDELYSKFNHSHPTLIERIKTLDKKIE